MKIEKRRKVYSGRVFDPKTTSKIVVYQFDEFVDDFNAQKAAFTDLLEAGMNVLILAFCGIVCQGPPSSCEELHKCRQAGLFKVVPGDRGYAKQFFNTMTESQRNEIIELVHSYDAIVLLSLGGALDMWHELECFDPSLLTTELVKVCDSHGLDGIDLDLEKYCRMDDAGCPTPEGIPTMTKRMGIVKNLALALRKAFGQGGRYLTAAPISSNMSHSFVYASYYQPGDSGEGYTFVQMNQWLDDEYGSDVFDWFNIQYYNIPNQAPLTYEKIFVADNLANQGESDTYLSNAVQQLIMGEPTCSDGIQHVKQCPGAFPPAIVADVPRLPQHKLVFGRTSGYNISGGEPPEWVDLPTMGDWICATTQKQGGFDVIWNGGVMLWKGWSDQWLAEMPDGRYWTDILAYLRRVKTCFASEVRQCYSTDNCAEDKWCNDDFGVCVPYGNSCNSTDDCGPGEQCNSCSVCTGSGYEPPTLPVCAATNPFPEYLFNASLALKSGETDVATGCALNFHRKFEGNDLVRYCDSAGEWQLSQCNECVSDDTTRGIYPARAHEAPSSPNAAFVGVFVLLLVVAVFLIVRYTRDRRVARILLVLLALAAAVVVLGYIALAPTGETRKIARRVAVSELTKVSPNLCIVIVISASRTFTWDGFRDFLTAEGYNPGNLADTCVHIAGGTRLVIELEGSGTTVTVDAGGRGRLIMLKGDFTLSGDTNTGLKLVNGLGIIGDDSNWPNAAGIRMRGNLVVEGVTLSIEDCSSGRGGGACGFYQWGGTTTLRDNAAGTPGIIAARRCVAENKAGAGFSFWSGTVNVISDNGMFLAEDCNCGHQAGGFAIFEPSINLIGQNAMFKALRCHGGTRSNETYAFGGGFVTLVILGSKRGLVSFIGSNSQFAAMDCTSPSAPGMCIRTCNFNVWDDNVHFVASGNDVKDYGNNPQEFVCDCSCLFETIEVLESPKHRALYATVTGHTCSSGRATHCCPARAITNNQPFYVNGIEVSQAQNTPYKGTCLTIPRGPDENDRDVDIYFTSTQTFTWDSFQEMLAANEFNAGSWPTMCLFINTNDRLHLHLSPNTHVTVNLQEKGRGIYLLGRCDVTGHASSSFKLLNGVGVIDAGDGGDEDFQNSGGIRVRNGNLFVNGTVLIVEDCFARNGAAGLYMWQGNITIADNTAGEPGQLIARGCSCLYSAGGGLSFYDGTLDILSDDGLVLADSCSTGHFAGGIAIFMPHINFTGQRATMKAIRCDSGVRYQDRHGYGGGIGMSNFSGDPRSEIAFIGANSKMIAEDCTSSGAAGMAVRFAHFTITSDTVHFEAINNRIIKHSNGNAEHVLCGCSLYFQYVVVQNSGFPLRGTVTNNSCVSGVNNCCDARAHTGWQTVIVNGVDITEPENAGMNTACKAST